MPVERFPNDARSPAQQRLQERLRQLGVSSGRELPKFAKKVAAEHIWRADGQSLTPWLFLAFEQLPDATAQAALEALVEEASPSASFLLWLCDRDGNERLVLQLGGSKDRWQREARSQRKLPNEREILEILASDAPAPLRLAQAAGCLARKQVTHRFYADIQRAVRNIAKQWTSDVPIDAAHRHELALILVARLMFLYFVQSKNWLPHPGYLHALSLQTTPSTYRSHWRPLFFDALNLAPDERTSGVIPKEVPYLNGGLFAESALEALYPCLDLPNEVVRALVQETFEEYQFVDDEHHGAPQAVAPQLLGEIFERLMDSGERRTTGAFYTPHPLALHVWQSALYPLIEARLGTELLQKIRNQETLSPKEADALLSLLWNLRVLDPAVGTGAFLLAALLDLESLAHYALRFLPERIVTRRMLRERWITHSLHGIDIQRNAVLLAELRLWLSVTAVSENSRSAAQPLPNLEHRLRVGNALLTPVWTRPDQESTTLQQLRKQLREVLAQFPTLRGSTRRAALETMRQCEAQIATLSLHQRLEELIAQREAQLTLLPEPKRAQSPCEEETALREALQARGAWQQTGHFDPKLHFADVMHEGGFDIIIGNPPWGQLSSLDRPTQRALRRRYMTLQGKGGRQAAPDMSVAFFEAYLPLLRKDGRLSFLFPAKALRAGWGQAWRRWIQANTLIDAFEELSTHSSHGFKAAVYPCICVLRRRAEEEPRDERQIFAPRTLDYPANTRPLSEFFRVRYGVKTGLNAAFLVPTSTTMPAAIPAVAGKDIRPFTYTPTQHLLFPHDRERGDPWAELPSELVRHFEPFAEPLRARVDLKERMPWWTIFRVRPESLGWRVAWRDIAQRLEAVVLPPVHAGGPLNLNSTYAISTANEDDAHVLCAWLNAPAIRTTLEPLAQRARNGYFRFDARLVAQAPILPELFHPESALRAQALALCSALKIPDEAALRAWDASTREAIASGNVNPSHSARTKSTNGRCEGGSPSVRRHCGGETDTVVVASVVATERP